MANWKKVLTEAQIDTDTAFGSASDTLIPSQLAVKTYVDAQVDTADAITELVDVTISNSASDELLFTTGANTWVNKTLAEAGIQPLDTQLTTLAGYSAEQVARGISEGNTLECDANIANDDFLRINGTKVEGRSAAQVRADIGAQAALTFGAANGNVPTVVSGGDDIDANDFAVFTADADQAGAGLKGRSAQQVRSDIGAHVAGGSSSTAFAASTITCTDLTVTGTTTSVSTTNLEVEDKLVRLATPNSAHSSDANGHTAAQTASNGGGIALQSTYGATDGHFARVAWDKDAKQSGWTVANSGNGGASTAYSITTTSYSTGAPSGNLNGVGGFHFDTANDNLYVRISD